MTSPFAAAIPLSLLATAGEDVDGSFLRVGGAGSQTDSPARSANTVTSEGEEEEEEDPLPYRRSAPQAASAAAPAPKSGGGEVTQDVWMVPCSAVQAASGRVPASSSSVVLDTAAVRSPLTLLAVNATHSVVEHSIDAEASSSRGQSSK